MEIEDRLTTLERRLRYHQVVAGILALFLGFLLRQYRAIFFALLNMAFSMILYGVLAKVESLGSTDGIGINQVTFIGFKPEGETYRMSLLWFIILYTPGLLGAS